MKLELLKGARRWSGLDTEVVQGFNARIIARDIQTLATKRKLDIEGLRQIRNSAVKYGRDDEVLILNGLILGKESVQEHLKDAFDAIQAARDAIEPVMEIGEGYLSNLCQELGLDERIQLSEQEYQDLKDSEL